MTLPLAHPHPAPPPNGGTIEVAPGLLWARLPLPYRLDHVTVYLIEDGWLIDRFGLPLDMTETEYLQALLLTADPDSLGQDFYRRFYVDNGLGSEATEAVMTRGHDYLRRLTGLPQSFRRVVAGDRLIIGGRVFDVHTGGGHASEQMMLFCAAENIFLAADQVLPRISPNVSVYPRDPMGDPLGIYLRSLRSLKATIPDDALVLPGHDLPFTGLHGRLDVMIAHHEERCVEIVEGCRAKPLSAAELVPVVFHRPLDAHQTGFAFSEILAHVNYLVRRGRMRMVEGADGIRRAAAV